MSNYKSGKFMKAFNKVSIIVVLLLAIAIMFVLVGPIRAATQVNLGTADNFAVLGGSTVTSTGSSVMNGDLGVSPGTAVTGFPPGIVNGTIHAGDATAAQAQSDLTIAYNNAASQSYNVDLSGQNLGGMTLIPGVYRFSSSAQLTGTLTLDAQGDPDAVFIFQIGSTLTTVTTSSVVLENSAQACHVFWQVGSSATLGTGTNFKGNILAQASITVTTGANTEGRMLARTGAVTLDTNTITRAICASPPPLINVVKVPTPLTLPDGPGSVTYDYTVTNIGTVAITNVTVIDDKCATVDFISGDTNGDSKLDTDETWHYRCTTTLSQTTTNTVTVTGQANGFTATDTASATVVVTSPNGVTSPRLPYTGK
jgi:hypothetical protein